MAFKAEGLIELLPQQDPKEKTKLTNIGGFHGQNRGLGGVILEGFGFRVLEVIYYTSKEGQGKLWLMVMIYILRCPKDPKLWE